LLTVLVSTASIAAPVKPAKAPVKKVEPVEPALPAPPLSLKVTPGTGGGPWRMQITNNGEGPVRIAADPNLLILELTPADAKPKFVAPRCVLPDDVRPATDDTRDLVIPPNRSWSSSFDPLFYCFGAKERAALVPGTSVKASFGWPTKATKPAAPFVANPVGASVGKVGPVKVLEAEAFTLSEAVIKPPVDTSNDPVRLTVPEALDAGRGVELGTTVTLVNGSDRPITVLFRPDMIQWAVSGPAGSVSCGFQRTVAAPIRELFVTVPVKGRTETSVLVNAVCPPGTFDEPGIYRLTPKLDTTMVAGRAIGLKTWEDIATAKAPLLLRVRAPRKAEALAKATLD
jgi:hypothetical protein